MRKRIVLGRGRHVNKKFIHHALNKNHYQHHNLSKQFEHLRLGQSVKHYHHPMRTIKPLKFKI